jgi:hypothetical protein
MSLIESASAINQASLPDTRRARCQRLKLLQDDVICRLNRVRNMLVCRQHSDERQNQILVDTALDVGDASQLSHNDVIYS